MAEYVEREALIAWLKRIQLKDLSDGRGLCRVIFEEDFKHAIRTLPDGAIADVAPVRHGRWVTPRWHNSDYCYNCSKCGGEAMHREYQWARNGIYPICPNCGAKMDGGADDEM